MTLLTIYQAIGIVVCKYHATDL